VCVNARHSGPYYLSNVKLSQKSQEGVWEEWRQKPTHSQSALN